MMYSEKMTNAIKGVLGESYSIVAHDEDNFEVFENNERIMQVETASVISAHWEEHVSHVIKRIIGNRFNDFKESKYNNKEDDRYDILSYGPKTDGYGIYMKSVKRVSDNQVFNVNDTIQFKVADLDSERIGEVFIGKISSFMIWLGIMYVDCGYMSNGQHFNVAISRLKIVKTTDILDSHEDHLHKPYSPLIDILKKK